MAFPASQGVLSEVLEKASARALAVQRVSQQARDEMAAGNVTSSRILALYRRLRDDRDQLQEYANTSGIGAYAQEQWDDTGLDIAVEFDALMTAIDSATAWIRTNFPTSVGGFVEARSWDANDDLVEREFTPTQTAGLRVELDAVIAAVS